MIRAGAQVEHPDYGLGEVVRVLGNIASVDFFGEAIDVSVGELEARGAEPALGPPPQGYDAAAVPFRRAFEAINLGVVPPDPAELIGLTIGGPAIADDVSHWLDRAGGDGLCRVLLGYYGSGKSHRLQLIRAIALRQGWVTAYLEFDPKSADPAKPQLVYQGLMNSLTFPVRDDGSRAEGFLGLLKEIRTHWDRVRGGKHLKRSRWFRPALEALLYHPHGEDPDYVSAAAWLFGQNPAVTDIRDLARRAGLRAADIPTMPRTKENAEIYVHHLVVVAEACKALGYRGLALILDEAEHVRNFNVRRRARADNLFDLLARAAHRPARLPAPEPNEHGYEIPAVWKDGPHFALFVGLTEGDMFADPDVPLREACPFLHGEEDLIRLEPPDADGYARWCEDFLAACDRHLGGAMLPLARSDDRALVVAALRDAFASANQAEVVMRLWTKLAALAPSALLAGKAAEAPALAAIVADAAKKMSGDVLPWD